MGQLYRTRIVTVEALQWTGENGDLMQAFLAPDSPLIDGGVDPDKRTLGVHVPDDTNMALYPSLGRQVKLAHAKVGDWIVKYPSGRIGITRAAQFEEYYAPVAEPEEIRPELLIEVPPPPAPDGVLANRQPELDADEQTVSER